jgi:hypothetical protein
VRLCASARDHDADAICSGAPQTGGRAERECKPLRTAARDDFVDFPPTPFMAEIRELAKEIALDRFGKLYDELTDKEVFECSVAAAEIRREKLLGNESIRF